MIKPINKTFILGLTLIFCLALEARSQLMRGPRIDVNNRVTFSVKAPDARSVKLINLSDSMAMGAKEYIFIKGDNGMWSVITNPCRPGFHYYELEIDGFRCSDPSSQMYFGWGRWSSGLEVPDKTLDFYSPAKVPSGEVRYHRYYSGITGAWRKCLVYTPPDYDENNQARYPVLYLQHGAGESELGWTMQGKVNIILDNLIAAQKARPMIIVMDNGYAARNGSENPERPSRDDNAFEEMIVNELIPMIDKTYRTLDDKNNRAIAGLSMGAGQALTIGLHHPELFSCIGAFSGGGWNFDIRDSFDGVFQNPEKINKAYNLLWLGCGDLDGGYEGLKKMHQALDAGGIKNTWFEGPGSHEWQVWRKHIHEFSRLLFR